MERNDYLIRKKFYAYLIPGVMMVAALQLGNLLDSVFVGNILGMTALSASSLGMPVVLMAQVPMMIFAVGGSTVAAVRIGQRDMTGASKIFRISFFAALIIQAVIALASLAFMNPLAGLLTADPEMEAMCASFTGTYLCGLPVIAAAFLVGYFMSVDNHPKESAAMHIAANVINLVLDYIFLAVMKTGIAGSVYSTIIGYAVSGVFFAVVYFRSPKRMLSFGRPKTDAGPVPEKVSIKEIFSAGAASGMLTLLSAVKIIVLNGFVLQMTGSGGMAVYAVSTNSMFLVQLCLHGVVGVIPTVGGILYGDKDYFGLRRLFGRAIRLSLIISGALTVFFILLPGVVGGMFGYDPAAGNGTMELCLRLFGLSFPFYAFNTALQSYYPTVLKPFYATFNTILQGLVILIPVTIALLPFMGVSGTGLASAIAEAAAFLIIVLLIRSRQKKGREEGTDMSAVPEAEDGQYLDITVKGTAADAAGLAHKVVEYCVGKGIPRKIANCAGIAAEELVDNIAHYSGQDEKISYIDIRLTRTQDCLVLRVRDDGVFFDPVNYAENETFGEDELAVGGLWLLLQFAKKVDYSRVLNMNNTIVEVALHAEEN